MQDDADWFAAGLALARLHADKTTRSYDGIGRWMLATLTERPVLPPVGVIVDLGALLFGASLLDLRASQRASPTLEADFAAAVRRYEDALLGRLAAEPRLLSAGFAVLRLPRSLHAQAVAILVSGVLARVGFEGGRAVAPGLVRTLTERTPTETARRGLALLRDDPETRQSLCADYLALARGAQAAPELLLEADLFALENLTVLGSLSQRFAIADVMSAAEAMRAAMPRRLQRRTRKQGASATRLVDESAFPVGGFASVSTSESLESLITSELVYMDAPSEAGRGPPEIDLFDVRFVQGELLSYTRDEAIHIRERRAVLMALDPSLEQARVKDSATPWQRLVVALSAVLVATRELAHVLGEEWLSIQVVFVPDAEGLEPLAEERALVGLLLREAIGKGLVEVRVQTWTDLLRTARERSRNCAVHVVRMAAEPLPAVERPNLPVRLQEFHVGPATMAEWSAATAEMLAGLV